MSNNNDNRHDNVQPKCVESVKKVHFDSCKQNGFCKELWNLHVSLLTYKDSFLNP